MPERQLGAARMRSIPRWISGGPTGARSALIWPEVGVRAANRHDLHRRIAVIILVGGAAETGLWRLQHAFGLPEPSDEGHADVVHSRLHGDAHLEMRVGG